MNADRSQALAGGLSSDEAGARLRQFGANVVASARPLGAKEFLGKFWGLVPWMLELAVLLDLVLGRWIEAIVIASLLGFNALLGFFQEGRAQRALALLRQRLTITARVRRDGRWQLLAASEIVPGDLLRLRVGDIVPADVELAEGQILLDQSQLTGESLPAEHRAGSTAYAGSQVSRGEATGFVTATGGRTYFGKTAELIRVAEAPKRFEILILKIAKTLAALVIILALGVLAATLIRGTPLTDMLPFGLMMLVAAVPVALPMMFTMSSTLGARALAENGVLVTRLAAIQDAAAMDVICLDKTGTITENRLTVAQLQPLGGATSDEVLRLAAQASDEATQDPIDLAILQAGNERGLLTSLPERLEFIPFDPGSKCSEGVIRQDGGVLRVIKGAPATLAEMTGTPWSDIAEDVTRLSADGARVLAVAAGAPSQLQLKMVGLIALSDPPRADSAALVMELRKRGVRILLVTGDGEATAQAIAAKVGITGAVAPAGTLRENLDPAAVGRFAIFARALPQDKFYLVQALQRAGHVVGMTGDGVNDAPALRQADVGIAVASSTDVAKAAASLVLTRPGLAEIIHAIDGSRRVYQRMQSWVLTMMSRKLAIPSFIALGVMLFGAHVTNPTQLVLLMFANDILSMSISTDRVTPSPTPDRWVIRQFVATSLAIAGLLLCASIGVFWVAQHALQLEHGQVQTLVFVWMVFAGNQAAVYSTRRAQGFFWTPPYPGRWVLYSTLLVVSVVTLFATQGWLMTPIAPLEVGAMLLLAVGFLIAADVLKFALRRGLKAMPHAAA
jgi:H+-transporting ATPase